MTAAAALPSDAVVSGLVSQIGGSGPCPVTALERGGNNEVFRLNYAGRSYALKKYLASPDDRCDRLDAEWSFLTLLRGTEPGSQVPTAHAIDRIANAALYDFVEGRKLTAEEIRPSHIAEACAFIRHLNRPELRIAARHLGQACDAQFSLSSHVKALDKRLERLQPAAEEHGALVSLLADLNRSRDALLEQLRSAATQSGIPWDVELTADERLLSPSDFGFHNALLVPGERLVFIDFEYAGWDDPAKLSADFFFQPAIRISGEFYGEFLQACLSHIPDESRLWHANRARLLRPVFGLIWCCIILNPFTKAWSKRRSDAGGSALAAIREERLQLAASMLRSVNELLKNESSFRPVYGAPS